MEVEKWNDELIRKMEFKSSDISWWRADGVESLPDTSDAAVHGRSKCCASLLRKIVSIHKNDHAGTGRKEAHYLFCGCGKKIKELAKSRSADDLAKTVLHFGQYKGRPLDEVPKDYLEWCLKNLKGNHARKIKAYLGKNK